MMPGCINTSRLLWLCLHFVYIILAPENAPSPNPQPCPSSTILHERGYRARVTDIARVLGFKGTVENLDDGRVKIMAEGDEDKLKWFEEAICIRNTLIDVSSIEVEYSTPRDDVNRFYKLVDRGETDSRLDTAADHLKNLIAEMKVALKSKGII